MSPAGGRRPASTRTRGAALIGACLAAPFLLSAASPGEEEETVRRWSFRAPGDLRGWEAGSGIADLRVEGGRLRGRITHADAYLYAPALRVPLDGLLLKVRWSCPRGGSGQCYFATGDRPSMGEDRVISREVEGGKMVETAFPLEGADGPAPAVPLTLTRFRLDPFNGNEDVPFEIEEVTLFRLPARFETAFAPSRSSVAVGEEAEFAVRLRPLGGRRIAEAIEATVDDGAGHRFPLRLDPGGALASCHFAFRAPGTHSVRAVLSRAGAKIEELEATIAVGLPPEPAGPLIASGEMALELLREAGDGKRFRAARLWAREGGRFREAGLLLPLIEVVTAEGPVRRRSHLPLALAAREERRLRLASLQAPAGFSAELEFQCERDHGPAGGGEPGEVISARATLSAKAGKSFLRFAGPVLRRSTGDRDPLERSALFGGLEFLEPGWSSSSERAVGPKFAARWTPHPLKICLPVMAIEAGGITTAVLWNPAEFWAPGRSLLAATFASPNFLEGQRDHLMALSVPPVGGGLEENETIARQPVAVERGTVALSLSFAAAANRPVHWAARRWYARFGIPAPPPLPHDLRATWDLLARSYGETIWWPEEKGWRSHWFLAERGRYRPDIAAELILHSKLTGERRWIEAAGLDAKRPLIEVAGLLWDRAAAGASGAEAAIAAMGEDGTYPYHGSPQVSETARRHTGGRFGDLGEEGSTGLGVCVQGALPILRHLVASGEAKCLEPAEKALRAMRRFRVPRGAQVWEVHKDIPDIRAAALAVEAFRLGYLATGDASYLDDAAYWAETGLAFVFSWRAPESKEPASVRTSADRNDAKKTRSHPAGDLFREPRRQVTPYGTIPVLGTTFYIVNWFGVLVQWCGLEWAWKVLDLCDLREDALLRAVADGVARSGLQQMFDREPWTGLYPDVWDLRGNWAGGALLHPQVMIEALRAGGHLPQPLRTWTRRVGEGREALLVQGWGRVVSLEGGPERLRLVVDWIPGEPGEILIARSPRPRSVTVGGAPLTGDGLRYDETRRLLGARFVSAGEEVRIEVVYRE